jgi:hypothetical protein
MMYLLTFFHSDSLSFSSVLRSLIAIVSVAFMIGVAAPAVQAQSTTPSSDEAPRWTQTFEQQVETLLEASPEEMQERGMQLIIRLADRSGSTFNFDTVRPELYDILFDYTRPDDLRILALSALAATGPVASSQMLAESIEDEPSNRVERHLKIVLEAK